MDEAEAREIIKAQGWTPYLHRVKKWVYIEATRKIKGTRRTKKKHIAALHKLDQLTKEDIIRKLTT